jgi:hypothetical protein
MAIEIKPASPLGNDWSALCSYGKYIKYKCDPAVQLKLIAVLFLLWLLWP